MNKTIYVSDDDLPLFEEAQRLYGGNLSAVVAHALKMFVESQRAWQEVRVVVGPIGQRRQQVFRAQRVAEWLHPGSDPTVAMGFSVYRTQGGRWALYRRRVPLSPWQPLISIHGSTRDVPQLPDDVPRLDVFDNRQDLDDVIPPEFARLLTTNSGELVIEELDI